MEFYYYVMEYYCLVCKLGRNETLLYGMSLYIDIAGKKGRWKEWVKM